MLFMWPYKGLKNYIDFIWILTQKELKSRYKHTFLGFIWVFINPLIQMLIIGIIFSSFINIPTSKYFLLLFSGLLPWQFFSGSVERATTIFLHERYLLKKAKFPLEILPFSIVIANLFNLLAALSLFVLALLFTNNLHFPNIWLILPASFALLIFTLCSVLLISSLCVKFRDVKFLVQALMLIWFYATPVLYSLSLITQKLQLLFWFNPLTIIFEMFHMVVLQQELPTVELVISNSIILISISILGVSIFKQEQSQLIDKV